MAKGFAYFLRIGDMPRIPVGRKPTLIICSPARQFPTGAIMPMTRRMELVAFAKRTGAYLLEDNFESEFNYEAPPTSSLFEPALAAFLRDGELERHTRRMKKEYRARRDDLTDCLRYTSAAVLRA